MSEPQEIEDIIDRSLIRGLSIQIGNLRFTASRSIKPGEPPSDGDIIRLIIKKDDGTYDEMLLDIPKLTHKNGCLIPPRVSIQTRLEVLKRIFKMLIWLGESLTDEKATLVEDV